MLDRLKITSVAKFAKEKNYQKGKMCCPNLHLYLQREVSRLKPKELNAFGVSYHSAAIISY